MEKVSVIVPVYNTRQYLGKCVESIIHQTYRHLEILLIDDGATDGSGELCDKYAEKDDRIRVVHQINKGISAARNKGLNLASGEYISFVDSDDYIEENMIEKMLEKQVETNADMIICNFKQITEEGCVIQKNNGITDETIDALQVLKRFADERGWAYITVWNRLYKRKIFEKIRFPEGKTHEDEWIAADIYESCNKITLTSDSYYLYRINADSIMGKKWNIAHLDGVEAVYRRFLKYQKNGWYDQVPATFFCARRMLESMKNMNFVTAEDKKRRREVIREYRYMLRCVGNEASFKDRLVGIMPELYFKLKVLIK
ncbi:MAG: glycosyltransferase [Lachnospiraceae bacterium]|nr:glycosyltransferase [Lachnospiraceae bacterium]